jgi:hypothetical protein
MITSNQPIDAIFGIFNLFVDPPSTLHQCGEQTVLGITSAVRDVGAMPANRDGKVSVLLAYIVLGMDLVQFCLLSEGSPTILTGKDIHHGLDIHSLLLLTSLELYSPVPGNPYTEHRARFPLSLTRFSSASRDGD